MQLSPAQRDRYWTKGWLVVGGVIAPARDRLSPPPGTVRGLGRAARAALIEADLRIGPGTSAWAAIEARNDVT
jgi:hypothetical protein